MPLVAGAGGYFAPIIRAYIRRSGAPDHVGMKVAVKDRKNALKNPVRPPASRRDQHGDGRELSDAVEPDPLPRVLSRRRTARARWCS
jgi:hypothetical protein